MMTHPAPDGPGESGARVRDMPAPRESKGLAGRAMARIFLWPHRVVLAGVYRAGFRPWQLTVLALTTNVVVGILLLRGDRLAPGLLLIVAGWFDVLDGAVARLRGEERRSGAFLDSVLDRVSDAILFGCLYWSLSGQGNELESALALVTLVTALSVSYIRADAEAAGVTLTEGYFQRLERYVAMVIGLAFPHMLMPMLMLLAVLGGVTVLQRSWTAVRRLPAADRPAAVEG